MAESNRCPDCGHPNSPGAESCERCNYPLAPAAGVRPTGETAPAMVEPPIPPPMRPRRPPRPRPVTSTSATLWLFFGTVCAVLVVFIAFKGFQESKQVADCRCSILADQTIVRRKKSS